MLENHAGGCPKSRDYILYSETLILWADAKYDEERPVDSYLCLTKKNGTLAEKTVVTSKKSS